MILSGRVLLNRTKDNLIKQYENYLNQNYYEIGLLENSIKKLNPKEMLNRGYAKIEQKGKHIKSIKDLTDENLSILLKDGQILAKPIEIKEEKWWTKHYLMKKLQKSLIK